MAEENYDILVIGGGPGGYTAAIRASQLGMKAAVLERDRLGGICLNWGCIPTKALLRNAEIFNLVKNAHQWGISAENVQIDFAAVIKRSRSIADRISKGVEYLMRKNSIAHLHGTAQRIERGRVVFETPEKKSKEVRATNLIVATGARARTVPGVTIDRRRILTSTEAMSITAQPGSMVILGAGAIGVEFAYFYNALGTNVTLVEMMPGILPVEDKEISQALEASLKKQGITIRTQTKVERAHATENGVSVSVTGPDGASEISADLALVAVGVQGNVENLGLETVGVNVDKQHIVVDSHYRTTAEDIYAIGDVIGPPWLAHVASAEGIHCVEAIAGRQPAPVDYSSIPGCTYCQPQVASVGMTEELALAEGHELRIGRFPFRPLGKAVAIGETEGMVKLIFDKKYGELLGAHILGSEATEMIAELVLARRLESTGQDIFHSVHAHPTLSEAVMEAAAAAYGEAINI